MSNGVNASLFSFAGAKTSKRVKYRLEYEELLDLIDNGLTKGVKKSVSTDLYIDMIKIGTKVGLIEMIPSAVYDFLNSVGSFFNDKSRLLNSNAKKVVAV